MIIFGILFRYSPAQNIHYGVGIDAKQRGSRLIGFSSKKTTRKRNKIEVYKIKCNVDHMDSENLFSQY